MGEIANESDFYEVSLVFHYIVFTILGSGYKFVAIDIALATFFTFAYHYSQFIPQKVMYLLEMLLANQCFRYIFRITYKSLYWHQKVFKM